MSKTKKPARPKPVPESLRKMGLQKPVWPKDVPPPVEKSFLAKAWPLLAAVAVAAAAAVYWFALRPKPVPVARGGGEPLNVVLITLDTTRADRLGCYGYAGAVTPNLDALARNGVRFSRAYAQVPLTLPSHASILTGLNPFAHGVHNNGAYALPPDTPTLAGLLKARGYKTAAFTASFSVDSRFGLDKGFDLYDDDIQPGSPFKSANAERRAEQVLQAFEPWFEGAAAGPDPFFAWVHFFDPHLPYDPPSPMKEEMAGRPYDGEIAYMDAIVGQVMLRLKAKGLLGKTLVVAVGDHGESFGEKGEYGHGVFLYEPAVHVPFLLFAEGRLPAGTVVDARVRLIDVLPTILDMVGAPAPEKVQGVSLIPYVRGKSKDDLDVYLETFYPRENFGWAALTGLIAGPRKYIEAPQRELYDLVADPLEATNLAGRDRSVEDMKERLRTILKSGTASSRRAQSESDKARLRSLGYVDYSDGSGGTADPKDKLADLKMIQDAERAEYEGRFADAVALQKKMVEQRPDAASSYVGLALAQAQTKDFAGAVATLRKGLERMPDSELLMTRLGYTYLVMSKAPEARAVMGDILKINPKSMDALTGLAILADETGRKEEALGWYEKALAVEPENKFLRTGYAGALAAGSRMDEAVKVYDSLIRDYPRDAGVVRALGSAYARAKDWGKAVEVFKKLTSGAPAPGDFFSLAVCQREIGDNAEAIRSLERYLENPAGEPAAKVQGARTELARLKASVR